MRYLVVTVFLLLLVVADQAYNLNRLADINEGLTTSVKEYYIRLKLDRKLLRNCKGE